MNKVEDVEENIISRTQAIAEKLSKYICDNLDEYYTGDVYVDNEYICTISIGIQNRFEMLTPGDSFSHDHYEWDVDQCKYFLDHYHTIFDVITTAIEDRASDNNAYLNALTAIEKTWENMD